MKREKFSSFKNNEPLRVCLWSGSRMCFEWFCLPLFTPLTRPEIHFKNLFLYHPLSSFLLWFLTVQISSCYQGPFKWKIKWCKSETILMKILIKGNFLLFRSWSVAFDKVQSCKRFQLFFFVQRVHKRERSRWTITRRFVYKFFLWFMDRTFKGFLLMA